jgi:hypothetical protein
MTTSTLRLIPPVRRRMSCCDSCCHSRCNAASNWRMFCTGGSRACIYVPNMLYGIEIRDHGWPRNRSHGFALEVGGYCSWTMSSIYTGLVASGWLSKWGTTTGCKTSLMYWSPVRLPCMVTKSSLQSWEIHPKPLLSLHRKGQLAGCSLGHRLYFCASKPSSGGR